MEVNLIQNKVSGVTFKAGPNAEELQIVDVLEVETRFAGWLHASLPSRFSVKLCERVIAHYNFLN